MWMTFVVFVVLLVFDVNAETRADYLAAAMLFKMNHDIRSCECSFRVNSLASSHELIYLPPQSSAQDNVAVGEMLGRLPQFNVGLEGCLWAVPLSSMAQSMAHLLVASVRAARERGAADRRATCARGGLP